MKNFTIGALSSERHQGRAVQELTLEDLALVQGGQVPAAAAAAAEAAGAAAVAPNVNVNVDLTQPLNTIVETVTTPIQNVVNPPSYELGQGLGDMVRGWFSDDSSEIPTNVVTIPEVVIYGDLNGGDDGGYGGDGGDGGYGGYGG
jgi:hypothetical protein